MIEARGTVHHFERADGVRVPSVSYPGALSRTPAQFFRMPPRLGEHSFDILQSWLGLEAAEFDRLRNAGIVADRRGA